MSHKTNSIALRINSSIGWKSHSFPKKKFYTRDITLLLRIYLLLKGYLGLYDYKLLFYELKCTHLIKIIYLTIVKHKEIKRKKTIWKPKNNLNRLQYKNVKYLIYTKSFFKNKYNYTKKFDLTYFSSLKQPVDNILLKKAFIKKRKIVLDPKLQSFKIYKLAKYFANINKHLRKLKRFYRLLYFIDSIFYLSLWKINYYRISKNQDFNKKFIKYIKFLSNTISYLLTKTKRIKTKNKIVTKFRLNTYNKNLLDQIKKYQYNYFIKKKKIIINKQNKQFYFANTNAHFYFYSKPWSIRLKKYIYINKTQKNLIYQKKYSNIFFINYCKYFNKQVKNPKYKQNNKRYTYTSKRNFLKLYYQSIPHNVKFFKKVFNLKHLIILQSKKNKYKIKAKNKLIRTKIKKKIYNQLNLRSNFYLKYYIANWIKYYFGLNISIKINNPLMLRYKGVELNKEREKKSIYNNYKYLKVNKKKYYERNLKLKKIDISIRRYQLNETNLPQNARQNGFASILSIATTYIEPQLIADYIANELQRSKAHSPILNNIRTQLQHYNLGKVIGIRIAINGRFNSSDRTRLEYIVHGHLPRNSYEERITYALGHSYARIGTFGVKIWLFY